MLMVLFISRVWLKSESLFNSCPWAWYAHCSEHCINFFPSEKAELYISYFCTFCSHFNGLPDGS